MLLSLLGMYDNNKTNASILVSSVGVFAIANDSIRPTAAGHKRLLSSDSMEA